MSLLKLAPESDRLRRLTRAYAAGEITTRSYRQARSRVVDGFAQNSSGEAGDDTQPRFQHRPATDQEKLSVATQNSSARYPALGVLGFALGLILVSALVWVML